MCPLTHCSHSGPHLQADEKRQLHTFPAFQFVPRPADSQKESRFHCLFGQIAVVFYSIGLEMKKEHYIGKAIEFLLSNVTRKFMEKVGLSLLWIRQTEVLNVFFPHFVFPLWLSLKQSRDDAPPWRSLHAVWWVSCCFDRAHSGNDRAHCIQYSELSLQVKRIAAAVQCRLLLNLKLEV